MMGNFIESWASMNLDHPTARRLGWSEFATGKD